MGQIVSLKHTTKYHFEKPAKLAPHVVRLRPAPHSRTPISSYCLKVSPSQHFVNWQQDPFGNHLARIVFPDKVSNFDLKVELIAEMTPINPFDFFLEPHVEQVPFSYSQTEQRELASYLKPLSNLSPELKSWLAEQAPKNESTVSYLTGFAYQISALIDYQLRLEPGVQTPDTTFAKGTGSCRDSAWLMVETLRELGFAARFVSGYLIQLKSSDEQGQKVSNGVEEDFTDLHAWVEVFLPGAGWVGLDPTSGLAAGVGHIPLAATPEPQSAAPVSGTASEVASLEFESEITRVVQLAELSQPFTEDQLTDMANLGQKVDSLLVAQGIELTSGGEPTFVATDAVDSPEWNTEADSAHKQQLASKLADRLAGRFGTGALVQHSQGKWYPGEPLPRWEKRVTWRKDGVPIWSDHTLLAKPENSFTYDIEVADRFMSHIAEELGLDPSYVVPLYEDPLYGIWEESKLPVDFVEPTDQELATSEGRRGFARSVESLATKAGYLIPLDRQHNSDTWLTSHWPLRRERAYLLPGDSPVGMRLPLDSLPQEPETKLSPESDPDPSAPQRSLHTSRKLQNVIDASPVVIRKAFCVEVRDGNLFVFMPPLNNAQHGIDLISVVERAARAANVQLILEGYALARHNDIETLSVTPDPGVIEVNVHPASSFAEISTINRAVYKEAKECGLAAEKFQNDGRHTGTGGGSHITVGGTTPADSIFLKNPKLLSSLIRFWQNHPSLSYAFAGLFIGPTSQAPRSDEARFDCVKELEIALSEIERAETVPPWLADRALRHLLTDVTGNTHRAEICIDKLFNPDSATGRLGIVELRAFEMPPHHEMASLNHLLVRACIAKFALEPYTEPLIEHGSDLHDRFMLPHYLAQDLVEVCRELNTAGIDFDPAWFEPQFGFRFPSLGTIQVGSCELELKAALEPWPVLGEETNNGSTARYVDSSIERLQVKLSGHNADRYQVLVNGNGLGMQLTGRKDEYIAGVRYRAWQPSSALHPTIGVHSPLTIELFDIETQTVVAAAKYHVIHPGGRNFEDRPRNESEAQSRLSSRFESSLVMPQHASGGIEHHGYTSSMAESSLKAVDEPNGPLLQLVKPKAVTSTMLNQRGNGDFPATLDLRNKGSDK